jgi:hypothetical protein
MSSVIASRRARTALPPPLADVALEYRPSGYFAPWSASTIATIRRAGRRSALRTTGHYAAEAVADSCARAAFCEDVRRTLARIDRSLADGAFLPTLQPYETEIARITLASTTHDVTAVYACQRKDGVFYRVVDEYGGRTLSRHCTRFSRRPLTLRELASFFASACPALGALAKPAEDDCAKSGAGPSLAGHELRAASDFYPGWADLVRHRMGGMSA